MGEPLKKSPHTPVPNDTQGWGGYVNVATLLTAVTIFIASGFSTAKAVEVYQKKFTDRFTCPYNKTGSCSNTLQEKGVMALIKKCQAHRHQG